MKIFYILYYVLLIPALLIFQGIHLAYILEDLFILSIMLLISIGYLSLSLLMFSLWFSDAMDKREN